MYAGQILAVCVPACLLGVALGRLLATPLLAETARAYSLSGLATIPAWAHLVVLGGVPAIVGLAAVAAAARAGRLSAVQAITVGRAPAAAGASGSGAHWPPPGCPGRSASAWARRPPGRPRRGDRRRRAARRDHGGARRRAGDLTVAGGGRLQPGVRRPGQCRACGGDGARWNRKRPGGRAQDELADPAAVRAAIQAQPGTARLVGVRQTEVDLAGSTEPLVVSAYDGMPPGSATR